MRKKTAVLGATGSIGTSALDVIRRYPDKFEPVLLTAHTGGPALLELGKEFPGALLALSGPETGDAPSGVSFRGPEGLLAAIAACGAGITVNGIAGAAGLRPSMAAIEAGQDLALANKETIVMAGRLVLEKAMEKKTAVIPVDSEHSAIFNLLRGRREDAEELILTASGGPFRTFTREELAAVTPKAALSHPTWNMGPKITVDSASLANKGLEVMEAAFLFGVKIGEIRVVLHPQSVVHSMIRMKDGAVYAQLSRPDMRLPIQDALFWPETPPSSFGALDFRGLHLDFSEPDGEKFPMLPLAFKAIRLGGIYPCVYNGANEEAVEAFLEGRAEFLDIPRIVDYVLSGAWESGSADLDAVFAADRRARDLARAFIDRKPGGII
ncbi:MAG: 1-deoxy-D-xylulose-5-phosphate reductoisomerase [Treponema sp.]|jgi:1-deoxy-D-xylulose-5-phosphate reductoisomerase|nr:1-deoxy-D-xylulose-5-phosphate reductoisomerase [Treponema sp.]